MEDNEAPREPEPEPAPAPHAKMDRKTLIFVVGLTLGLVALIALNMN